MGFFEDLFNTATGVVNRVIDFEFKNLEFDLIKKARADEAAANQAAQPAPAPMSGPSTMTLVLFGGAAVAVFLLLRK